MGAGDEESPGALGPRDRQHTFPWGRLYPAGGARLATGAVGDENGVAFDSESTPQVPTGDHSAWTRERRSGILVLLYHCYEETRNFLNHFFVLSDHAFT